MKTMKHLLFSVLISLASFTALADNFFVITFSEKGPKTIEGRHRDYIWIVPAESVKALDAPEICPFLIDVDDYGIRNISVYSSFMTIIVYYSDLQKLIKEHRNKVLTFKTKIDRSLKFETTVYITPIKGDISKFFLLNWERTPVYYSDSFTFWAEGFDTDEYYWLKSKWFPAVPYRCYEAYCWRFGNTQ